MVRRVLAWACAIAVGIALGLASAWAVLENGRAGFATQYGGWRHSRAAGSVAADPYTRAIIARDGLLALSAREARYFTLDSDTDGRPLEEGCVYELASPPLATRWWSLTLYARDNFLAQNPDNAHSVDASRVLAAGDGGWRVRVSPVRGDAANWISSRNAGRGFSLTLRVYNAYDEFQPSEHSLPAFVAISCAGEAP